MKATIRFEHQSQASRKAKSARAPALARGASSSTMTPIAKGDRLPISPAKTEAGSQAFRGRRILDMSILDVSWSAPWKAHAAPGRRSALTDPTMAACRPMESPTPKPQTLRETLESEAAIPPRAPQAAGLSCK